MFTSFSRHLLIALACTLAVACGGADVGESCDDPGSTDECVDDAICTNEDGTSNRCRELCEEHEDCPANHSCSGLSSSNRKSCQPD